PAAAPLTDEQRAAVCHPAGLPARVLAGAGTGKTRVITERFRHLVESGVSPERILALTFSRPAAAQMRSEVVSHLKASGTLWISTFHSFCLRVLDLERGQPLRLVHEPEARAILAGLAGGAPSRRVEEAHAFIGQAKDQLLTPEMVKAYAGARGDERLLWLADLYQRFQDELERQERAEFGDFIYRAERLLQGNPAVAARWQGRFDHILVDEFQDTNLAQFSVLQLLAMPHGNLMVVGDDDQAIYRFRGATDRFMREFPLHAPGAVSYPVVENFRCPQPVLDVANRLIERNAPERVEKQLRTLTKQTGYPPVAHWEARSDREEADAVAAEIERRVRQGAKPSSFAILLRSVRRCGGEFARALRERSVPYRLVGESFPHPVVGQTLALLRLTRSVTVPDVLTVLAGRVPPVVLFRAFCSGELLASDAYRELRIWLDQVAALPVDGLVYEALRFLGHLRLSLKPTTADLERMAAIRLLQEQAAAAGSLDELLAAGDGATVAAAGAADAVTIMTVHAAKGLQFDVVFVSALAEGLFPVAVDAAPAFYLAEAMRDWADTGTLHEPTGTERLAQHIREERRLAYVALTRAKQELILTRALTYGGEAVQPTRFLAEMGAPPATLVSGRMGDVVGAARAFLVQAAAGERRAGWEQVAAAASVLKADPGAVPLRRQVDPAPFGPGESLRLSA
ncbi:MAG TPA: ATP-dependent helicase, partial [Symbiobacteriaceae bacterium]|nr:ATP-dependent helicase [Symbiobacteriaceae bacterium]